MSIIVRKKIVKDLRPTANGCATNAGLNFTAVLKIVVNAVSKIKMFAKLTKKKSAMVAGEYASANAELFPKICKYQMSVSLI